MVPYLTFIEYVVRTNWHGCRARLCAVTQCRSSSFSFRLGQMLSKLGHRSRGTPRKLNCTHYYYYVYNYYYDYWYYVLLNYVEAGM